MFFKLNQNEPAGTGITRIITEQIDYALHQLYDITENRDEAAHNARKSFKRIRSVLKLIKYNVDKDIYRLENTSFKNLSKQIADVRDSMVLLFTFNKIIEQYSGLINKKTFSGLLRQLEGKYAKMKEEFFVNSNVMEKVADSINSERKNIYLIQISGTDFSVLYKGLKQSYSSGREKMKLVYADPSAENFHDWRKSTKYLWYNILILEEFNPLILGKLGKSLEKLSDILGDSHDLEVLKDYIIKNEKNMKNKEIFTALIDQKINKLNSKAKLLGRKIYHSKPKNFVDRIRNYLKIYQNQNIHDIQRAAI